MLAGRDGSVHTDRLVQADFDAQSERGCMQGLLKGGGRILLTTRPVSMKQRHALHNKQQYVGAIQHTHTI